MSFPAPSRKAYIFLTAVVFTALTLIIVEIYRPYRLDLHSYMGTQQTVPLSFEHGWGLQPNSKGKSTKGPVIMCGIVTRINNFQTKTRAVINTWAKRCDQPHFFYSGKADAQDKPERGVPLSVPDGRGTLTEKSHAMFQWAYGIYNETVDWYMKCDDDTYVIMENLKRTLSDLDPSEPYYIGERSWLLNGKYGYHSGGAGYLLSREAARRLVTQGLSISDCPKKGGPEDGRLGKCMGALNVTILDGRDTQERSIFHSFNPMTWMNPKAPEHKLLNYRNIFKNDPKTRRFALSTGSATFHYVSPHEMYMYDFLIYELCLPWRPDCELPKYSWSNR